MTIAYEPPFALSPRAGDAPDRCAGCATPLAADQRHCIACGLRCAPDELRLAALPATVALGAAPGPAGPGAAMRERPFARSAAVTAAVVLALGIGIGATIGPAAVGETVAAQRPVIVLAAAPAAAPLSPALSAPLDNLSATPDDAPSEDPSGDAAAPAEAPAADDAPPAAEDPSAEPDPAGEGDDPAPPGSTSLAGVVVAVSASGEGFSLADRSGALLAIHASGCGVAPGDDLHLRARKLANGTWAADRVRRVRDGIADVRAVGRVSWVDPAGGRYALAARGTTLLVTVRGPAAAEPADPVAASAAVDPAAANAAAADPAAAAPATPASLPTVGERIRARIELRPATDDGAVPASLVERKRAVLPPLDAEAAASAPLELDGAVASVDPQARVVVLALDDATPPTATIALLAPAPLDLTRLLPAQRIATTAALQPDGTYALTGTSADGDAATADDATALQGDQAAPRPAGADDTAQTVPAGCELLGPVSRTSRAATIPPGG